MCGVMVALACCSVSERVEAVQEPAARTGQRAPGDLIDLNQASAVQLESLPGIGERTAERIIEYRRQNDGFKKVEELMNVRGIGERSFLRLRPLVTVGEPKTDAGTRD
jgi:competence protein ComEA|tara:strand:+ start:239 stop:562 length:324 start_codon:yes stop_codon:yes gene_type:complete